MKKELLTATTTTTTEEQGFELVSKAVDKCSDVIESVYNVEIDRTLRNQIFFSIWDNVSEEDFNCSPDEFYDFMYKYIWDNKDNILENFTDEDEE